MFRAACLLACAAAVTACATPPPERPPLCQLAYTKQAYAGRVLTVEGYVLRSAHGSLVIDPRCGHGVGIAWSRDERRLEAFAAVMREMGTIDPWMVRVRVTGVMELASGEWGPEWRLNLAVADVLSVRRLPDEDWERYSSWLDGPSTEPFRPSH